MIYCSSDISECFCQNLERCQHKVHIFGHQMLDLNVWTKKKCCYKKESINILSTTAYTKLVIIHDIKAPFYLWMWWPFFILMYCFDNKSETSSSDLPIAILVIIWLNVCLKIQSKLFKWNGMINN